MAPTQRFYTGNAAQTTISTVGGINATATSFSVASAVSYPASVPFTIVVDVGLASEEKMLVTAVVSNTFTVTRGFDGTTGAAHAANATVNHVFAAQDATDFSGHIFTTAEDDHTQYVKAGTVARGVGSIVNTASVTVTGTTALTSLQAITFPANSLLQGFYANGISAIAISGTGSATFTATFAGTTLAGSAVLSSPVNGCIQIWLVVLTGGASATASLLLVFTAGTAVAPTVLGGTNITGVDLTMPQVLQFKTTNSANGVSTTQTYTDITVQNV